MNYQRLIDGIESEYNPEHDLIPDAPRVTWADAALLELVKDLYERIYTLEAHKAESDIQFSRLTHEIDLLEDRVEKLEAAQAENEAAHRRIGWQLPE